MIYSITAVCAVFICLSLVAERRNVHAYAFGIIRSPVNQKSSSLSATKRTKSSGSGFGTGGFGSSSKKKAPRSKSRGDLISALNDDDSNQKEKKASQTFVKADQEKCKSL